MTSRHTTRALTAGGVLLALYPAVRPWGDVTAGGERTAFASMAWPLAHLAAVAGFALVTVGLLGLRDVLSDGPGAGAARGALGTWWLGTALVLPYYGAEASPCTPSARAATSIPRSSRRSGWARSR
jgi:hypothetical protein